MEEERETTTEEGDWIGGFYHVYNRGTEKRNIFLDEKDYRRFLLGLAAANSMKTVHPSSLDRSVQSPTLDKVVDKSSKGGRLVDIGAYCLMPNHFHLLVYERVENGLSRFIQKLSTGYTKYFNEKYERTGVLFQGKHKKKLALYDEYLKYLFVYIHLNPIDLYEPGWRDKGISNVADVQQHLLAYPYSSYPDYLGVEREENVLLNGNSFPAYFSDIANFQDSHTEWLSLVS